MSADISKFENMKRERIIDDIRLIVAGGGSDGARKTSDVYLMDTMKWVEGPELPMAVRYGGSFTSRAYPLVIVGGENQNNTIMSSIMAYNQAQGKFITLDGMLNTARAYSVAIGLETDEVC